MSDDTKVLLEEYDRLRQEYAESKEKYMPEIKALLNHASQLENKAIEIAEEHGLTFHLGNSRLYVSTKLAQKVRDLEKHKHFRRHRVEDAIEAHIYDEYSLIEGYWEPSTC